jgi:hypothetical protein
MGTAAWHANFAVSPIEQFPGKPSTPHFGCEFFLCWVGGHSSVGITSVDRHNLGGFSARELILVNSHHMKLCPSWTCLPGIWTPWWIVISFSGIRKLGGTACRLAKPGIWITVSLVWISYMVEWSMHVCGFVIVSMQIWMAPANQTIQFWNFSKKWFWPWQNHNFLLSLCSIKTWGSSWWWRQ